MRIVITGATGLLGRNLLFEILKQNLQNLDELEIIILGRSQDDILLDERLGSILENDGALYMGLKRDDYPAFCKKLNRSIRPIVFDLRCENLGISKEDFSELRRKTVDLFFHMAALTDFRSGNLIEQALEEVNVKGTQRVLTLVNDINVKQFIYVGSAYSCGSKTGLVEPDYVNPSENFRNPYERSKLIAEILVREFANEHKIQFKIFRPSTICGRLLENPIGSINKFDVFYGWAAFFLRYKYKQIKSFEDLYVKSCHVPIRLHFNPQGGLNIVPVDYAAKMMYYASLNGRANISYHLANREQTPNQVYGEATFSALNIYGIEYVLNEPQGKNKIEELYYRTVGGFFTPYGISNPIVFNVDNLRDIEKTTKLSCPVIDRENFLKLLEYAKKKYFGLIKEYSLQKIK